MDSSLEEDITGEGCFDGMLDTYYTAGEKERERDWVNIGQERERAGKMAKRGFE